MCEYTEALIASSAHTLATCTECGKITDLVYIYIYIIASLGQNSAGTTSEAGHIYRVVGHPVYMDLPPHL